MALASTASESTCTCYIQPTSITYNIPPPPSYVISETSTSVVKASNIGAYTGREDGNNWIAVTHDSVQYNKGYATGLRVYAIAGWIRSKQQPLEGIVNIRTTAITSIQPRSSSGIPITLLYLGSYMKEALELGINTSFSGTLETALGKWLGSFIIVSFSLSSLYFVTATCSISRTQVMVLVL